MTQQDSLECENVNDLDSMCHPVMRSQENCRSEYNGESPVTNFRDTRSSPKWNSDDDDTRSAKQECGERLTAATEMPLTAKQIHRNFLKMSVLFAINHGCSVSCLGLANARLGVIGAWQSSLLFISFTFTALLGSSYFVKRLGSKNGLVLGMGMNALYVASFFVALIEVAEKNSSSWIEDFVVLVGAIVGGAGSSVQWTSQGTYFSLASEIFAAERGEDLVDVTSRFGGSFAFIFLIFEVILRVLSTLLIEIFGSSWKVIFGVYSVLSILPAIYMVTVADLENQDEYLRLQIVDYQFLEENSMSSISTIANRSSIPSHSIEKSPVRKAAATLDLLVHDPKAKYMSFLSIVFGLSTAFNSAVVNSQVVRFILSDDNSTFVGFYTAVTSSVASVASLIFGILEASHSCLHCGKGVVVTIGASSYLVAASLFIVFPYRRYWNWMSLLGIYSLFGVGRATYEGTLRAIYADFFPNEKEGAFSNIILFTGLASTTGNALSVTTILHCETVSRYCLEYEDGTIHNVLVMEILIVVVVILAIPAFWRASWLFKQEQSAKSDRNSSSRSILEQSRVELTNEDDDSSVYI